MPLVYRIDALDNIFYVNDAWMVWARQNDGDSVMPDYVLGRKLWACMGDPTVLQIYQRMVAQARAGKPVQFNYRCDSPAHRRVFAMSIHSNDGIEVEFASALVHEEVRPVVALLQPGRKRDQRMLRICSWCQRVAVSVDRWLPVEEAAQVLHLMEADSLPCITHGMCERCAETMLKTLEGDSSV